MISKKILFHDLSFSNKNIELEYEESKRKYKSLQLIVLLLHVSVIAVVGLVLNPFRLPYELVRMLCILTASASCLVIALLGWRKPSIRGYLLMILALGSFFWIMESYLLNGGASDETLQILVGMNKEIIGVTLILAKTSWKFSSCFQLLINSFCAFRYTNFEQNFKMNFFPLIQLISRTILLSLSAYFLEKYDKENFERIKKYEYSLSCFKNLITKFFPSAVLIIKDEKILFHNEKTLKILNCQSECQIWNKLENLQLDDVYENSDKRFQKENFWTEDYRVMITENFKGTSLGMSQYLDSKSTSPKNFSCIIDLEDKKKSLELNSAKIIWEDEMALMIIISENEILERMKFIKEKSEYKDRLLATVSHDLRTPLNGIMGMIQTTIDINADLQTRKFLNIALRSSQLLLLMINDILDYSQISNGKLRLNFETFCLWGLIREISRLFKFQAKTKGLMYYKENLVSGLRESTLIRSDQNRIKQILFNLLGNALKFTTIGSIKISLTPWKGKHKDSTSSDFVPQPQRAFVISILDTGIGIKKEDQTNLFKLYGKLQNENTSILNKNGVGLGLAVSQGLAKLVNRHIKDGEISVVSEYEKGSCFSVVFFSDDEEEEICDDIFHKSLEEKSDNEMKTKFDILERGLDSSHLKNSLKKGHRKKKILVVEDDQINILVISTYLKSFDDYEFDIAFNGEEAVRRIKRNAEQLYYYDVILMDYNMPKMSGSEAASIINQMIEHHEIPTLILIICTANASFKQYDISFQNGILDHITKPFTKEQIRKKIERNYIAK